jgi:hypothetical protein
MPVLLITMIGCAPRLADNFIVPEFPKNETDEINLSVYDKDGKIARSSLVLRDSNDYSDKKSTANFALSITTQQIDSPEVVYTNSYNVPYGSWAVISIPDDVRQGSMRRNINNIRDAKSTTDKIETISEKSDKDSKEIYSTTGYYNYAENQIEKELLRIGFNVVDRAKFISKFR